MSIDRRNFLSMMAALPFTAKAEDLCQPYRVRMPPKAATNNFFVWVHGVFGMSWMKATSPGMFPTVELFCPTLKTRGTSTNTLSVG